MDTETSPGVAVRATVLEFRVKSDYSNEILVTIFILRPQGEMSIIYHQESLPQCTVPAPLSRQTCRIGSR